MCGDGKEVYRDPQQEPRTYEELKVAANELDKARKKKFSTGTEFQYDHMR